MPIIPDEGRTFGLDALFTEVKIYAPDGPALHLGRRRPALVLRRGPRAGRSSRRASPRPAAWRSFQAAGTAYATWSTPMLPIYLFYSMFGFQRIGDLIWQAADARARGFLHRVHGRADDA